MDITRETIAYATEADWLAARRHDITSTEAAALFNAGVYENARTRYELYHLKANLIEPAPFDMTDRVRWGTRLESAIAYGIAEDLGLVVAPFKTYMRIPELRMGSSFDFKVVGLAEGFGTDNAARALFRQHGEGILEIKNVDGFAFRRSWLEEDDAIEAPPHIELQVAHQFEVSGLNWGIIAPLVGGNTPKVILRERDEATGNALRLAAAEFWTLVDSGVAPEPDFTKDGAVIRRQFQEVNSVEIDMRDNNRLAELCMLYKQAADQAQSAESQKEAAQAEILTIVGDARKVLAAGGYAISSASIAGGFVSYERKPYRRLTVSQKAA